MFKKQKKLLLILSLAAQLISYIGALIMLLKKEKTLAGVLAAIGIVGTIAGIALLSDETDKNKKIGNNTERKKRDSASNENAASNDTESVSEELNVCIDELSEIDDIEDDKQNEFEGIDKAIEILKNSTGSADADFEDVSAEIEEKLCKDDNISL